MLINKEDIYKIKDDNIFFKTLCEYFINNSNGKLGNFY